jgi:heterodisulfide reductase subunit C
MAVEKATQIAKAAIDAQLAKYELAKYIVQQGIKIAEMSKNIMQNKEGFSLASLWKIAQRMGAIKKVESIIYGKTNALINLSKNNFQK